MNKHAFTNFLLFLVTLFLLTRHYFKYYRTTTSVVSIQSYTSVLQKAPLPVDLLYLDSSQMDEQIAKVFDKEANSVEEQPQKVDLDALKVALMEKRRELIKAQAGQVTAKLEEALQAKLQEYNDQVREVMNPSATQMIKALRDHHINFVQDLASEYEAVNTVRVRQSAPVATAVNASPKPILTIDQKSSFNSLLSTRNTEFQQSLANLQAHSRDVDEKVTKYLESTARQASENTNGFVYENLETLSLPPVAKIDAVIDGSKTYNSN